MTELSSDDYGGRAPMSEGERMTLDFLENAFREAGLEPLFGDSFRQAVELVSMATDPATAQFDVSREEHTTSLQYADDYVAWTQRTESPVEVQDSEIVFVGYGVVAPEYDWNDYEGVDMRGKTALILINDPGYALQDPAMFKGHAMTYYGRWRYKFEEAVRQGAEAAIIIHDTEPAAYGWNTVRNSWTGPQFYLPS
ncbi:MAG: PA domain-containing protein, partial [Xanthomonadales bacterium]|nr:PA domain-containing protein [Xanthomonadales bacterium]